MQKIIIIDANSNRFEYINITNVVYNSGTELTFWQGEKKIVYATNNIISFVII